MEVILAKSAGFCFGVERAVDKVYEQLESGKKIYTYGPIIHNEEVVRDLESRGVSVIRDEKELAGYVKKYCKYFGEDRAKIMSKPFKKLVPATSRPYADLYISN